MKKEKRLILILLCVIALCLGYVGARLYIDFKEMQDYNSLAKYMENETLQENVVEMQENVENEESMQDEVEEKSEKIAKLEELHSENQDIIAWIEIENSDISYPVMQGSDNSFYMNHNYKKEYSYNGSIFLDKDYAWNPPSSNLLIYGHNMKNGTMFEELLKYKDENFYNEHKIIKFTTLAEDAEYEILAVFKSRVYYKNEKNVFRYYYFINAQNEAEYNEYVSNAKRASLYDTGVTAKYGEQLLTLSTCEYSQKDGRFVVVAKKIKFHANYLTNEANKG